MFAASAVRRSSRVALMRRVTGRARWYGAEREARLERMRGSGYHRHPLAPVLVAGLAAAVVMLGAMFLIGVIGYAYREIGIGEGALLALLVVSLAGGAVNIPIATWRTRPFVTVAEIAVFGVRYRLPVVAEPRSTVLAVNLGGAVVPAVLSIYLLVVNPILLPTLAATAIVTAAVYSAARPVHGLGIAIPPLLPPAISALAAVALATHGVAAVAYVAGTLGTLVGGDLLHLRDVRAMAPAVASIGGAGTFDGVFLSGILAVLLIGLA
jgi:uncharacterized membrane protein